MRPAKRQILFGILFPVLCCASMGGNRAAGDVAIYRHGKFEKKITARQNEIVRVDGFNDLDYIYQGKRNYESEVSDLRST